MPRQLDILTHKLLDTGFLEFSAAEQHAKFTKELQQGNIWILLQDETLGRGFFADAEWLAEGGIGEFLTQIRPALTARGVNPRVLGTLKEDFGDAGYCLTIDGRDYIVYHEEDVSLEKELQIALLWRKATECTFTILNHLLVQAGSQERAFLQSGGHELKCVFLVPAQLDILQRFPEAQKYPYEMPYPLGTEPVRTPEVRRRARTPRWYLLALVCILISVYGKIYMYEERQEKQAQEQRTKSDERWKAAGYLRAEEMPHFTLTLAEDFTVHRTDATPLPHMLTWIVKMDGEQVLGRNAANETSYKYFRNFKGHTYTVHLEAFAAGKGYVAVSNTVTYTP